jgi:hypothetical protein
VISRRKFFTTTALGVPALAIAGCADIQAPAISTEITQVISAIQSAVATVAQYIPTAEAIAGLAASLFGPQWASLVTLGSAAINSIISALESLTPPVTARFRASGPRAPVVIGNINGIQITGYRSVYGTHYRYR